MYHFIHYQVGDVMTTDIVTVGPDAKVKDVTIIFDEHDFNSLPVVDRDNCLIGMVTKLDVLKAFSFRKNSKIPLYDEIMDEEVSLVMSRDLVIVEPETPLTRVINRMILTRHKSFPVVENDILVGMVAREDVLYALRRAEEGKAPDRMSEKPGN